MFDIPDLSFLPAPAGNTGSNLQPMAGGEDPGAALVRELMASLEAPKPIPPPQVGRGRQIIGSIGDALLASSSVLAGGRPPAMGPFRATLLGREQQYQTQAQEAEAAARDLRNRIKIGQAERKIRILDKEQEQERDLEIDKRRQAIETEQNYRSALINRIVDLGIDTSGKDLLTQSNEQLQGLLAGHDPQEVNKILLSSIPDGFEISSMTQHPNGTVSFTTKPKGSDSKEVLTPAALAGLAGAGVDVSGLTQNKELSKVLKDVASQASMERQQGEVRKFYSDSIEYAKQTFDTDPFSPALLSSLKELDELFQSGAGEKEVSEFYNRELDAAQAGIDEERFSEDFATQYLARIRQYIKYGFPNIPLEAKPLKKKQEKKQGGNFFQGFSQLPLPSGLGAALEAFGTRPEQGLSEQRQQELRDLMMQVVKREEAKP